MTTAKKLPTGIRAHGAVYYFRAKDRHGKARELRGSTDLRETVRMRAEWTLKERRARMGLDEPAGDDPRSAVGPLLDDYLEWLRARTTAKHVGEVAMRTRRVLTLGGIVALSDLTLRAVERGLDRLRPSVSARTLTHYTSAVKAWSGWLAQRDRVPHDPLAKLQRPANPEADRRRERRALTPEEMRALIAAAHDGPTKCRYTGPERAILYRLAIMTGLRSKELATLTPASFDLVAGVVRVARADTKNRKGAEQPLPSGLAADLATFLAGRPERDRLWPLRGSRPAEMMRHDLEAAGVPYLDARGRVADFHSLRTTYVTWIGVEDPGVAVSLARHSDARLTFGTYHDPAAGRKRAAVESIERLAS
jgi:integrase